jgi:hypothetical protein
MMKFRAEGLSFEYDMFEPALSRESASFSRFVEGRREVKMRGSVALIAALGGVLFASGAGAADMSVPHHPHHRHFHHEARPVRGTDVRGRVEAPGARGVIEPSSRDNPNAEHGEDGLSTDPDNCNTGCIGGNPD